MGFVFGSQTKLYYRPETWSDGWAKNGVLSAKAETGTRGTSTVTAWRFPSDGVENFSLTGVNNSGHIHTISSGSAVDVVEGLRDYSMSFDYFSQRHNNSTNNLAISKGYYTSLEYYGSNRNSDGTMQTLTFAFMPTSSTTLICKGGVIENFSCTGAAGERIKYSVSLKFSSITTGKDDWDGSPAPDLNTTWETMNDATLVRTSWFDNGVANFSFSIANAPTVLHKIGTVQPAGCYEAKQTISGSCDVFLNSTGTYEWEQVFNATKGVLTFCTGDGADNTDLSLRWIFRDVIFTEIPITSTTDTTALQSGMSWIAGSVELGVFHQ